MNWISIKDQLPIESEKVLCALEDGCIQILPAAFNPSNLYAYRIKKAYPERDPNLPQPVILYKVLTTHWMPLPEPPKEDF